MSGKENMAVAEVRLYTDLFICSLFLFPSLSDFSFPSWFFWWFLRASGRLFICFLTEISLLVTNWRTFPSLKTGSAWERLAATECSPESLFAGYTFPLVLQWSLDLTKCQGTGPIGSLYRGPVISKTLL